MSVRSLIYDLENFLNRLAPKALFAGDQYDGQPVVVVTDNEIVLSADPNNGVRVDPDFGVLLGGKLSLSATPDQVSIGGGYWRLNPLLLTCIPSTTPTPLPTLVKANPALLDGQGAFPGIESYLTGYSEFAK